LNPIPCLPALFGRARSARAKPGLLDHRRKKAEPETKLRSSIAAIPDPARDRWLFPF